MVNWLSVAVVVGSVLVVVMAKPVLLKTTN